MFAALWSGILRELKYLRSHKWDLSLVTVVPAFIIVLFSCMFYQGKPDHLPIALIDQDHSALSQTVQKYISHNNTLSIYIQTDNLKEAEQLLNQTRIWGYVLIPPGAEQRLVQAKDAEIAIAFNQSYFSVGNTISSAMLVSTLQATSDFMGSSFLEQKIPFIEAPTPHVKISALYNPGLSYEFYLEPFMIPAILHLLLCCCVAFAVGQEFKFSTQHQWTAGQPHWGALFSKCMTYVVIFTLWTWLWMLWLIEFRGWFTAGSLWLIMLAQILFYSAYAFISATVVLVTGNLAKTFGFIAVYGGSSLSFAGVTLPLNNAPLFTKFWANIIPYTPYAKLQTEQWVIGSPLNISVIPFTVLLFYCLFYFAVASLVLKKKTEV